MLIYFSEIYYCWFVFFVRCSSIYIYKIYLRKRTSLQITDMFGQPPKFYLCQGFCMPNLGPRIWVKAFWRSSVVLIPSLGVSAVTLAVTFLNRLGGAKFFKKRLSQIIACDGQRRTPPIIFWNHIHCFKFQELFFRAFLFIYLCLQFFIHANWETRTPSPWQVVPCWRSVELTCELVIWMPLGGGFQ